jgi:hypothetical protein
VSVWPRCTNAKSDLKAPTYGDEVLPLSSDLKAPTYGDDVLARSLDLKVPTYGDAVLALSSDLRAPNDLGCGIFVGRAFRSDAMFAKHLSTMHR